MAVNKEDVEYKPLLSAAESDGDDEPPPSVKVQSTEDSGDRRWSHVGNLDDFFTRVYQYYAHHGFFAFAFEHIMELFQFLFLVFFAAFLVTTIRFDVLFSDVKYDVDQTIHLSNNLTGHINATREAQLSDVLDLSRLQGTHPIVIILLLIAMVAWGHRLMRSAWKIYKIWEIRGFYKDSLNISPSELKNYTWSEIVERLKEAQEKHRIIIQKRHINELEDIYHRILRFTNYEVALVNKGLLPTKIWIPLYGEKVFCTQGLMYNYRHILFHGPKGAFKDSYHLKEEYRDGKKRNEVAKSLQNYIAVVALVNLIFAPVIFVYQILVSFFTYAELAKRQPGSFGTRKWSQYGRLYLRHYNELDHDLDFRLSTSYKKASEYISHFHSPITVILARHVAFVAGSFFAVLLVLTVIQEDLLTAPHILTSIGGLGLVVTVCRMLIPPEYQRGSPKQIMCELRQRLHYIPDEWLSKPHTSEVHRQFTQVFQFRVMYIVDELLSPLITPFILYFLLRPKALDIVNFFRQFTIDISGVGNVCSYAEMSIRRHGDPRWNTFGPGGGGEGSSVPRPSAAEQGEMGKTEMSLLQFKNKHPKWKAGENEAAFLSNINEATQNLMTSFYPADVPTEQSMLFTLPPRALTTSLHPLGAIPSRWNGKLGQSSDEWAVLSLDPTTNGSSSADQLNMSILHHLHDQNVQQTMGEHQVAVTIDPERPVEAPVGGNWEWGGFSSFVGQGRVEMPRGRDLASPLLKNTTAPVQEPQEVHASTDDMEMSTQYSELPPLQEVQPLTGGSSRVSTPPAHTSQERPPVP
jgi:autophagy-related protein 9